VAARTILEVERCGIVLDDARLRDRGRRQQLRRDDYEESAREKRRSGPAGNRTTPHQAAVSRRPSCATVPRMAGLHTLLAWLTVGSTLAVLVASLPGALGRSTSRLWIDRAILLEMACAGVASLAGLALAVSQRGPADLLHFVYGVAVLGIIPASRYIVRGKSGRRFARWIAVAALIAMGALLRSFMTGR
jgi:hypothetical protein